MLDEGLALTEAGPHRRQGLTECKVSQNARSHRGSNIMNKGKLTEGTGGKASQKRRLSQTAGPH